MAHYSITRMVNPALHDIANRYPDNAEEKMQEFHKWQTAFIEKVIEEAAKTATENLWGEVRSLCPLCNGGPNTNGTTGFTLPVGLERHLTQNGNANLCPVMHSILYIAGLVKR